MTTIAPHAVGLVLMLGAILAAQQGGPDRSKVPPIGPAPALTLPPIQKRVLSNGVPVWVVEMHKVPTVDITLIVKTGASADPAGKYGLASFTAAMLTDGAGTRSALELADAVDFLGASLTSSSTFDASNVRLRVPVSKLDTALTLMGDVAMRATFPAAELERRRKERLTNLLQTRDNPAALASVGFSRLLYGPRHRYGTPTMGNDASNGEMSRAELTSFYTTYYQPQNSHLLVVGDITPEAALAKLEHTYGSWKNAAAPPKTVLPDAAQHGPREIYLINKPGAPQSQIRVGWIGVARNTPDYFVLEVLNTILGGSFTSRLNQNLREQHGYAYGASSAFDLRASSGPFSASAGVQTDKTVESLQEFFKELDGMRQPVPADELARAKNYVALRFPGSFETTAGVAGHLADLVIYGLSETLFNQFVSKIQAVTAADIERAARQYFQTDRFAVVVVGDLARIEAPIRAANIAPVKIVSVDDIVK